MQRSTFFLFITISLILLQGCVYHNECGISTNLYDEKSSYYDSQGNYREECPESNIVNYSDFGIE